MVKLREYQKYSVDKYFEYIKEGLKHVCIALYTGTGKTVVSAAIAKRYIDNGGTVIFIAPRVNLVHQTSKSFNHLGEIQTIQGSTKFDENGNIYMASLSTLVRRDLRIKPALIIIDEKHFGAKGKSHKKVMDRFPDADILSLSATPFDENGHPLSGFDAIIKYKNIKWFIDNKFLVNCECFSPFTPDLSSIKRTKGDYTDKELDPVINNSAMIGEVVKNTKDRIVGKKCLFFAVTISHAENIAQQYNNVGFVAKTYHSKLDDDVRKEILEDFKNGKIDILVSVAALVFGFDQPDVTCLIIARPTRSISFFRQLIGRGMRISPGKTSCLVLDCAGIINSSNLPNSEVVPRDKKDFKTLKCKICETKSVPYTSSVRRIDSILKYVTTWKCLHGHFFESFKEVSHPACKNCSKIIQGSDFRETSKEYEVFSRCECGEESIIRTIPKSNYKLKKVQSKNESDKNIVNQSSILDDLINSNEDIVQLKDYIKSKIHPDLQYDCFLNLHDSRHLEASEVKDNLMNTIIDSALKHNEFGCLSSNLLKIAYNKTTDPVNIIYMHNSRSKKRMQLGWLKKTIIQLRIFKKNNPSYSDELLLFQVKEKCKDINKKSQKMSCLYYFFDTLS